MFLQFRVSSLSRKNSSLMVLWIFVVGLINLSMCQSNPKDPPKPQDPPNQQSTTPADSLCFSDPCPVKRGNYYFPMPNNCTAYYKCAGNSDPKPDSCGPGRLFDKTLLDCVPTSDESVCLHCPSTVTSPTYIPVGSSSTVSTKTSAKSPSSTAVSVDYFISSTPTITGKTDSLESGKSTGPVSTTLLSDATTSSDPSVVSVVSESVGSSLAFDTSVTQTSETTTDSTSTSSVKMFDFNSDSTSSTASANPSFTTSTNPSSTVSTNPTSNTSTNPSSASTNPSSTASSNPTSTAVSSNFTTSLENISVSTISDVSLESVSTSSAKMSDTSAVVSSVAVPLNLTTIASVSGSEATTVSATTKGSVSELQSRNIFFSRRPSDVVVEGSYVEFECTFNSEMDSGLIARLDRFSWSLNGKELEERGRITIVQPTAPLPNGYYNSTLRFSPALSDDSGNLTCCAITSNFIYATSLLYHVLAKPRVSIAPEFVTAGPGDPVELNCTTDVVSDIRVSLINVNNRIIWMKDGHSILSIDELMNSSFPVSSVINTTFLHSANVTCIAEFSLVNVTSGFAFIHITNDDRGAGCQPESASNVNWLFTEAGDSNYRPCPGDKTGIAVRTCSGKDRWGQPDLSACVSKNLVDLGQQIDLIKNGKSVPDNQTMINLAEIISNSITYPENMTETELQLSIQIISNMADIHVNSRSNIFIDKRELMAVMKTVDVLLSVPNSIKFSKVAINSLAVSLLSSVDSYSSLYARQYKSDPVFFMSRNLVLETDGTPSQNSSTDNTTEWEIPSWNKINWTAPDAIYWTEAYDNVIVVNDSADVKSLDSHGRLNYSSSCIKNLGNLMPLTENETMANNFINSYLVSLTIVGLHSTSTPPVSITLEHLQKNSSMTGKCVYWNFSASDNGAWMDSGCETVFTNESHTTCKCNHLTNFAILMSPFPATGMDDVILSIISMVGCIISVIALVLTIVLYVTQWKKLKSKRAAVLINLCVALIIANVIFLAGSNQTKSEIGCKIVAALLQYFFLVAFFLMLLEGIMLLIYVVHVFYVHHTSHTVVLLVCAWFIPAIIVAVSLGVTRTKGYGTDTTCWLSVKENVLWAFVGPALFVILVNLIIIVIVLVRIANSRVRSDLKKKRNKILSVLRNVAILSPILGITWVFGVLSVNNETVVFQYIFAIANSLQGLFIFVLHGLCHAKNKRSSTSSKPKRWTGPPSKTAAQLAHIPLSEGDSQENLVRPSVAEQDLNVEQGVAKEGNVLKVPYVHQMSNMSHGSNVTAQTYISNSVSASGRSSQQ